MYIDYKIVCPSSFVFTVICVTYLHYYPTLYKYTHNNKKKRKRKNNNQKQSRMREEKGTGTTDWLSLIVNPGKQSFQELKWQPKRELVYQGMNVFYWELFTLGTRGKEDESCFRAALEHACNEIRSMLRVWQRKISPWLYTHAATFTRNKPPRSHLEILHSRSF